MANPYMPSSVDCNNKYLIYKKKGRAGQKQCGGVRRMAPVTQQGNSQRAKLLMTALFY